MKRPKHPTDKKDIYLGIFVLRAANCSTKLHTMPSKRKNTQTDFYISVFCYFCSKANFLKMIQSELYTSNLEKLYFFLFLHSCGRKPCCLSTSRNLQFTLIQLTSMEPTLLVAPGDLCSCDNSSSDLHTNKIWTSAGPSTLLLEIWHLCSVLTYNYTCETEPDICSW